MIRLADIGDAEAIARIYNDYILNTTVTFEEQAVSSNEMAERIRNVCNDGLPWLVCEEQGQIAGYAYATKWRVRHAYRFSVETTIYLAPIFTRRGLGTKLYQSLLEILTEKGMHLAIGGIALPNDGSVKLHERFGFEKVAHFKEVGFKLEQWIDVGYWQLNL